MLQKLLLENLTLLSNQCHIIQTNCKKAKLLKNTVSGIFYILASRQVICISYSPAENVLAFASDFRNLKTSRLAVE